MAPFPLPHSDITFPSPFSKSRIRAWGPTISTYSVGLGERPCLPLKWCPKCVTGWLTLNKACFPSKLGLLKLKWGNARDTELFSFLPILGHLPQLYASLSGYSQPFFKEFLPPKFSITEDSWHELWEQGPGIEPPWVLDEPESLGSGACGVREGGRSKKIQILRNSRSIVSSFLR